MLDLTKSNLSYYTVPSVFVLCFIPHAIASVLAGKNYDLANPRKTVEHCGKDTSMDKATLDQISRCEAAAANGLETVSLYAAGIVAANVVGVPALTLNWLSLGYVASRAFYNFAYIVLQNNRKLAPLRSLSWNVGIAIIVTLFVKAGNAA